MKVAVGSKFAGHFAKQKIYATFDRGIGGEAWGMMFAATAGADWFVPINARSYSQSLLVDSFTLLVWMCFNCRDPLKEISICNCVCRLLDKRPEVLQYQTRQQTPFWLIIEEIVSRQRVPERLLSDRGPNFLSSLIKKVCQLLGTTIINTSGNHPQCDGLVEKFNSTLINIVSKSILRLPYVLLAYLVAVQDSMKLSSF